MEAITLFFTVINVIDVRPSRYIQCSVCIRYEKVVEYIRMRKSNVIRQCSASELWLISHFRLLWTVAEKTSGMTNDIDTQPSLLKI